jgi:hypothetical protein
MTRGQNLLTMLERGPLASAIVPCTNPTREIVTMDTP